jgi:tetratricopeptide (TPR) repeat protein
MAAYEEVLELDAENVRAVEALAKLSQQLGQVQRAETLWQQLGLLREERGERGPAITAYEQAVSLVPAKLELYTILAHLSVDMGDPNRAVGYWLTLGRLAEQQGKFDEALEAHEEAVRIAPEHIESHEALARLYERTQAPEEAAVSWLKVGLLKEQAGQRESAITAYEQAMMLSPDALEIHEVLAKLYERSADNTRASASWRRLGLLTEQEGQLKQALQAYEQAGRLDPEDFQLRAVLARLALEMGDPNQAAHHWLAFGQLVQTRGQLDQARQAFEKAAELRPEHVESHEALAKVYERLGTTDLALESWRKVGWLTEEAGQLNQARQAYAKALELAPERLDLYEDLARITPEDVSIHETIARLSEAQGDIPKAVTHWQKRYQLGDPFEPGTIHAEERLVDLGVLRAGKVYRQRIIEQERQGFQHSVNAFQTITEDD